MKRISKMLYMLMAVTMILMSLSACGGGEANKEADSSTSGSTALSSTEKTAEVTRPNVQLEVVATDPEYQAKEREIWNLYEEENPNVKINLISINEDQASAFDARISAGTPSDIMSKRTNVSKNDYTTFVNLQEIDYPYWDKFTYDIKNAFSRIHGISESYTPVLSVWAGKYYSFIMYEDEMQKAGLNPRQTVRNLNDLDNFLAQLKAYIDKNGQFKYVFDIGWDSWFDGSVLPQAFAEAAGYDTKVMQDVFLGKIRWDDVDNNPYAAAFKLLKDYYDKGYMPQKWWTRSWDKDYEPGFISKQSILAFHGPWLWSKVLAADPNAKLSGFPLPINKDGKVWQGAAANADGACMFTCNKGKTQYDETVKAFVWFNSPEIVKLRSEALGLSVCMDMGDVGAPDLKDMQTLQIVKPFNDGVFGKGAWDSAEPCQIASAYVIKGKPDVLQDDAIAVEYGNYFEGKTSLEYFMGVLQKRWEDLYDIPK